jgi:uncharacterized UBP type Zn finger protein
MPLVSCRRRLAMNWTFAHCEDPAVNECLTQCVVKLRCRVMVLQSSSWFRSMGLGGAAVRTCDGGPPTFARFSQQRCSGCLNDTSLRHPDDIRDHLSIFDARAREHR